MGFYSDLMGFYTDSMGYEWEIPSGYVKIANRPMEKRWFYGIL